MIRWCVGSRVHRLLLRPPSVPPVSSAWQRYWSDGFFMGRIPGNRPTLATLQFDPPMACDILNSELTRTGSSTRVRHVRQRVAPSRCTWISTSIRPRELCQDRLYHDDTSIGEKDNRKHRPGARPKRQRQTSQASQRLLQLMECDVSGTGNSGAKRDRPQIRVKVKRKKPLKAKRQVPNNITSNTSSKEAEEFFDCQEPQNLIQKLITMIWESSKMLRDQLREGKNADLKKQNSTTDEHQILLYKNRYEKQIQRKARLLSSRSVNDNELQTTKLSQNHCPQDSSPLAPASEVILSKEVSFSEELEKDAPPKAPQSQDSEERKSLAEVPASSYANLRETKKACEELEKCAPASAKSLSSYLRSREEGLMNSAKKETIHRWRSHNLRRPSETLLKQMYLDAVCQYAIRIQNKNEKRQHEMSFLAGHEKERSKVMKKLRDQRCYKLMIQRQLKDLNSSKCKSNIEINYRKRSLKDKKLSRDEKNLNQLKKEVYEHLLNHFDDESKPQGNEKNVALSKLAGKLNDKEEFKYRIAGVISKCMFLVQNRLENEYGRGIAYEELDKDVAEIAEDIWNHHVKTRDYSANITCEQEMGESHCENESMGKCGEIGEIEEITESKESEKSEEEENGQKLCQKSKEHSLRTNGGMKRDFSSCNVVNPEPCILDQVERVIIQCGRLKKEIERRSSIKKSYEELNKKCLESEFKNKSAEEEPNKEYAENDIKSLSAYEVKEGKPYRNRDLDTGLGNNSSEDSDDIIDVIIGALKKECKKRELREKYNNNDKPNKSTQTEEEDLKKKCELKKEPAPFNEKALREWAEGEPDNESEDTELTKKCQEGELKKRCTIDEEIRKWKDYEQRKKCADFTSRKRCAENDNTTTKKCEKDNENEPSKCEEEDGEDVFLNAQKICEEREPKEMCGEEKNKKELAKRPCKKDKKVREGIDTMTADLLKNFTTYELKNWCEKIDRQKRCADEQLKKVRKKTEGNEGKGKIEFSKLTWPEGLNGIRKRKTVRVKTSLDGNEVFPDLNGIFRMPGYTTGRLQEPLFDPVPSVYPKLNARDHRELSLRQRQSVLYPGSTFPNNLNPLMESNYLLRRLWPDLNPLSINSSLGVYWLR